MSTPVKPVIRAKKVGERHYVSIWTPQNVLPRCKTKERLQGLLDYYSHPFLKLRAHTPHARRHYVELIRPALRFFCKKYGIEVPEWLKGNRGYDKLPPEEFKDMFGDNEPLKVNEFQEITQDKR